MPRAVSNPQGAAQLCPVVNRRGECGRLSTRRQQRVLKADEKSLVEGAQTQHFCDGLIGGPAHGREPRSLVGQARQHQEQGEFGGPRSTQRGGQAQLIGELLERQEQAKDGAADGSGGKLIELAAEGAPEGLDADGAPAGEVGEGAFFDVRRPKGTPFKPS